MNAKSQTTWREKINYNTGTAIFFLILWIVMFILVPYQITKQGEVHALESVSYPLGVRGELEVRERSAKLNPGDVLFLFSDGVVEARAEGSEELFGFERLEECLGQLAGQSVDGIRDGVLRDLELFTRNSPREDDLTVLVLEIP